MSKFNFAVYAEGCMYPASATVKTTVAQLQASGFETPILSLFHIGRDYDISPAQIMGDIYFNNTLLISQGSYVGDPAWPELINGLPGSSVKQVCASIGGGGVMDYQTLQKIYTGNGNSFDKTNLKANFECFRKTFPAIGIIDMDCEETYDTPSFVAFCQMLAGMELGITFCPYAFYEIDFWTDSLAALNKSHPGAVKWWNLQCYDGGYGNDPAQWAAAIGKAIPGFSTAGFILAGDWTNDTPSGVQSLMGTFKGETCVGGGFIWTLDDIIAGSDTMTDYVNAISVGLGNLLETGSQST